MVEPPQNKNTDTDCVSRIFLQNKSLLLISMYCIQRVGHFEQKAFEKTSIVCLKNTNTGHKP